MFLTSIREKMVEQSKKLTDPPINKIAKRVAFYTKQDGLDTVVFVHGLRGHYQKTWKKFPELLVSDHDLPCLDVLLWGYKTGVFRPLVHDTKTEGKHLLAALGCHIANGNAVHLVGHSMGGLIILEGLVHEMIGRRAQDHPSRAVSFISLFALPVSGVTAAAIVKNTLGRLWFVRMVVNKHIRSLARGEGCDALLNEVYERVYRPTVEDTSAHQIPIRMIMATRDTAVSVTDRDAAIARYRTVQPLQFDYDHSGIKAPDSRLDERYRALVNDLQEGFARRFQGLCRELLATDDETKNSARIEFTKRYETLLRRRFVDSGGDPKNDLNTYRVFLKLVIQDGARLGLPPFDTANRAIIALRSAHLDL